MNRCPDCRNPVVSLMMIDARNVPEPYCERCARAVEPVRSPAAKRRETVPARR